MSSAKNETKLLEQLSSAKSMPEEILLMKDLASLRTQHAVEGILSEGSLQQLKAEIDESKDAEKQLVEAKNNKQVFVDVQATREFIQTTLKESYSNILLEKAEKKLQEHPEFQKASAKPVVKQNTTQKELGAALQKAIIKHGPVSAQVREIREQIKVNGQNTEKPKKIDLTKLRKKLLGRPECVEGIDTFVDGKIDLTETTRQLVEEMQTEIEIQTVERINANKANQADNSGVELKKVQKRLKDLEQQMAIHTTALKRAVKKAKRWRASTPLKAQILDQAFEQELKNKPKQLRAIFLENSLFLDHVLYVEWDGKQWRAEATLSRNANEQKLIDAMFKIGAKTVNHSFTAPNYKSWAKLQGGERIQIDNQKGYIYYVPRNKIEKNKITNKEHPAPRSERGQIRLSGYAPKDAVQQILNLSWADKMVEKVPFHLIYRGDNLFGRVSPLYEPYASGREELGLPEKHMMIHGLTGINNAKGNGAIERLTQIVETGGLKSIAERRRIGVDLMTMSPVGDIASGIDMGVPCKIGTQTTYGSQVFFALHPSAIQRRDLWFSDRDFGGGHDRFGQYEEYAKKLGQKSIHDACPAEGRKKHLKNGLGNTNEVYFLHEISWNDVDTLFVEKDLVSSVKTLTKEWKEGGKIPEHVNVEGFSHTVATTAQAEQGEWTFTPDGEIVYVSASKTETPSEPQSLADRIQRRAIEIQAEWEG